MTDDRQLRKAASSTENGARGQRADVAGDLPRSIGRPATRALAEAGITSLDELARLSEAELASLHGIGPKAVAILRDALAAHR
ncbi:helix-hairpin-helix domain-containing protein [Pseudactinotalea suaedae]|uniref:helix-hairpin-helix domain-containing protein n=1 Tax=Pseudactinotalea suaedae TaxID=1524924 RepID=UPI0012E2F69D|nr:helix-hairpin-helix domain-containing protein [Pseudactinotalea suaedae]